MNDEKNHSSPYSVFFTTVGEKSRQNTSTSEYCVEGVRHIAMDLIRK